MKDAFGGAFMLRIMIAFFVIFICFMTVAISFARTFAVKNGVIDILESNATLSRDKLEPKIEDYLKKSNYVISSDKIRDKCTASSFVSNSLINGPFNGVCIIPHVNPDLNNNDEFYYTVTAYIILDFPLFNFGTAIPISGESITIVK